MVDANTQRKNAIITKLRELGGAGLHEDDIVHEGRRIVLPESMTDEQALRALADKVKSDEETMEFSRTFQYRPWDGAYAVQQAFQRMFGFSYGKTVAVEGMFGPIEVKPQLITIDISPTEQAQVPWGAISVPVVPGGEFWMGSTETAEQGDLFQINVTAKRKYRFEVEGIFALIEEELRTNSIYRGKAIDGADMPKFLNVNTISPAHVHYSDEVQLQLQAHLWSVLENTEAQRNLGLPLKRAIMLAGEYGQGKTLAGLLTAQTATRNGWTFLYARPGEDDLRTVMQTARLYAPAVVFTEDIDAIRGANGRGGVKRLSAMLDTLDGIAAKGTELVFITTTNHPDRITPGMLRPGRLDAIIHIGSPDRHGIERLIRSNVRPPIDDGTDFDKVAQAVDGYPAAFVKETGDRAVRFALLREPNPNRLILTTDDFVHAANGLRPQYELMRRGTAPTLDDGGVATALATAVNGAFEANNANLDN